MSPLHVPRRTLPLLVTLVAVGALTAACGDDAAPAAGSAPPSSGTRHVVPVPEGATEAAEPMPRLVVADASTGAVEVLDLASGAVVDTVEASGPASLATDGRFVYATDHDGGAVTVIDSGSWVVGHGDHVHAYTGEVATVGVVEGSEPAHVIPNAGSTTIFFDGTGHADVLRHEDVASGELEAVATFETVRPHHGLAVALAGHVAVSIPAATSDELPIGVEVRHDDGDVEATFAECPEMHGEAGFAEHALFACADGLLRVSGGEGGWTADKLAYPEGTPAGDRTWSLAHAHGAAVVAGILGDRALVVVDGDAATTRRVELPAAPIAVAVAEEGRSVVALTDDGVLHLVDAATAAVVASGRVLPAVVGGDEAPVPQIVVDGTRAYVSDPLVDAVVEVALNDAMRIARTLPTSVTPARLVLTGAA